MQKKILIVINYQDFFGVFPTKKANFKAIWFIHTELILTK